MPDIGAQVGLVRIGTIKEINLNTGIVSLVINDSKSDFSTKSNTAPIPASWTGAGGEFAGGYPSVGSTVLCTQIQGGQWAILSSAPSDSIFKNNSTLNRSGFSKNQMQALKPGRHLIQVKNNIRQILDPNFGIQSGDPTNYIHIDPINNILSNIFDFNMSFTEGSRFIVGPVLRDVQANASRNILGSALTSHEYNKSLVEIGLDPKTKSGDAFTRNPGFIESREIIYEFRDSFGFSDDLNELKIYDDEEIQQDTNFFPRDKSRADVLGLSLINPNHLIETIKGTVVDIYGNLVDLNRNIIPSGSINALSFRNNENNASETFESLRRESRKAITYHFEINARKEEKPDITNLDSFLDSKDYARNRSRFFFDIDREGQFKLNVAASSETGNVALPVRYENYSVISASENDTHPRAFVRNIDNQDIFLDSFGKGCISLSGSTDSELKGYSAPVDRITNTTIKLGTVFHDMSKTLELHNIQDGSLPIPLYPQSKLNLVPKIREIFSPEIIVNGESANAGGRSGTINLDGHLSWSIGANTLDRQSLWFDCAGGVISNIGRDKNGVSYAGRYDGDVLINIGGQTINDDSRFSDLDNEYRNGALDIRIYNNNQMTILRISETGINIYTPGELDFTSEGHIRMKSRKGNVYLDGKGIYAYADEIGSARMILRKPGKSID